MNKIIVWSFLILFGIIIGFSIGGWHCGNIIKEEIIFSTLAGGIIHVHQSKYDVNILSEKTCLNNCSGCSFVNDIKVIP